MPAPKTMQYTATQQLGGLSGWVRVESSDDSNYSNNDFSIRIFTYPAGDVAVSVASANISA